METLSSCGYIYDVSVPYFLTLFWQGTLLQDYCRTLQVNWVHIFVPLWDTSSIGLRACQGVVRIFPDAILSTR